jgi:hypothetical protein
LERNSPARTEDTPSVVREAWRARLFDELAEKSARRRQASAMRLAVLTGVAIGAAGSVLIYLS